MNRIQNLGGKPNIEVWIAGATTAYERAIDYIKEDLIVCEQCGHRTPIESAVTIVDGCYLCKICDGQWRDFFGDCVHEWEPNITNFGDAARWCAKCGGVVEDDVAHLLFPLICDGWVEVEHHG